MINFATNNPETVLYAVVVLFLMLLAHIAGGARQRIVIRSLFLLWFVNMTYIGLSGDYVNELFYATGDGIVGVFLLSTARGNKGQIWVGSWFIPMMVAHLAYWLHEPQTYLVQMNYWVSFTVFGWLQLVTYGSWVFRTTILDIFNGRPDTRVADNSSHFLGGGAK